MGANESKTPSNPRRGEASEFYWACRNGNYEKVGRMISGLSYQQLNQLEPNGSTALHAATNGGHINIVKLLLDRGCARTMVNRYGNTPYEEATIDQMRTLYLRPTSERFVDENTLQPFGLSSETISDDSDKDEVPDNWFVNHSSAKGASEATLMNSIARAPVLIRKTLQQRLENECREEFESLMNGQVAHSHDSYERANELLNKYKKERSIEPLLTLYTLETPLYGALQDNCEMFTALIYLNLNHLKSRAYQGFTYRGARMTDDDIKAYRWAHERETRILETRTVQSMSKSKARALEFAKKPNRSKPISVLLIFNFKQPCRTAVDLTRVSDALPAISEYQDEQEVTLLPFSLFRVTEIKINPHHRDQYQIVLENVPVPKTSVTAAWLGM